MNQAEANKPRYCCFNVIHVPVMFLVAALCVVCGPHFIHREETVKWFSSFQELLYISSLHVDQLVPVVWRWMNVNSRRFGETFYLQGSKSIFLENCALLGYCLAISGNSLPTFRDKLSVPSSSVKNPRWFLS